MSADKVLSTQNASGNVTKTMGKFRDVFKQSAHERVGLVRNAAVRRRQINFPQPFNFGVTLNCRVPQVDYIGDCYIKLTMADIVGGGTYRENYASQIIQSFRLRNAGKLIQEHLDSPAVYNYMLDRLSDEKLRQIEKIQGKAGAAGGVVIIPVMAFWCSWTNTNLKKGTPLHYGKLSGNEGLVFEFTTNAESRLTTGTVTNTGALITDAQLVFSEMLTESDLMSQHKGESFVHFAHDFKCRSGIDLAANVAKEVDTTALTGITKMYFINNISDVDAGNEAYTSRTNLTEIGVNIDGREYQKVSSHEELVADNLLWGQLPACSDDSGNNYVFFGVDANDGSTGALNLRDVKDCKLTIKSGVDSTACVVAVQDVCFKIQNGSIYRYE